MPPLRTPSGEQPRIRGESDPVIAVACAPVGNNPAYAGKRRCSPRCLWLRVAEQPRMSGESGASFSSPSAQREQPRTRGEYEQNVHWIQLTLEQPRRNNPAYAGKRSAHGLPASTSGEQPRIRGEKRRMMGSSCVPEGTTPRMRGKDSITSRFIEHLSSCHSTGSYTTPIK